MHRRGPRDARSSGDGNDPSRIPAAPRPGCPRPEFRADAPVALLHVRDSGCSARLSTCSSDKFVTQLTQGAAQPLPTDVAVEGVDEFLTTVAATTVPWPFTPATIDLHTTEGPSWRLILNADGVRCDDLADDAEPGDLAMRGAASELVLYFYARVPLGDLETTGDTEPMERLADWDPNA
ncbi:hypothetical protein ACWD69_26900 [Micromonospora chokoriensis]